LGTGIIQTYGSYQGCEQNLIIVCKKVWSRILPADKNSQLPAPVKTYSSLIDVASAENVYNSVADSLSSDPHHLTGAAFGIDIYRGKLFGFISFIFLESTSSWTVPVRKYVHSMGIGTESLSFYASYSRTQAEPKVKTLICIRVYCPNVPDPKTLQVLRGKM
jgi:hypothetical protein